MDNVCNKDDGYKSDYVITPERTQEILQAFGLQLVKDPADSKASGQQGQESSVPQGEKKKREAAQESLRDSKQSICQSSTEA